MCKDLLPHNSQCYPSGLELLLASSIDEKAEVLNGFLARIFISVPPCFYVTEIDH